MSTDCRIYRCAKQDAMYLYLRGDFTPEQLPDELRQRTGRLTQIMQLALTPQRKLARVDVARVIERLASDGWYLQMPPQAQINAHLYFGD